MDIVLWIWFGLLITVIIVGLFITSIIVLAYAKYDYYRFIHRLANEKTFEEIDKIITEDETLINSNSFKGHMLDMVLDHKELWEQIKSYKQKNEQNS